MRLAYVFALIAIVSGKIASLDNPLGNANFAVRILGKLSVATFHRDLYAKSLESVVDTGSSCALRVSTLASRLCSQAPSLQAVYSYAGFVSRPRFQHIACAPVVAVPPNDTKLPIMTASMAREGRDIAIGSLFGIRVQFNNSVTDFGAAAAVLSHSARFDEIR